MPHHEDSAVMRGEEEVVVVLVEIVKEVTDVVIKVIRKVVLLVTLTRLSVVVMVVDVVVLPLRRYLCCLELGCSQIMVGLFNHGRRKVHYVILGHSKNTLGMINPL